MKSKIIISLMLLLLTSTSMFAVGFPVTRTAATAVENASISEENAAEITSPAAAAADRQTIAILLWLFLGGFAGHRWYLGSPIGWNILFILTAGFFFVGWVIDGIEIITGTYPGL